MRPRARRGRLRPAGLTDHRPAFGLLRGFRQRGLRRRGYPAAAIREFCAFIGVARTNSRHQIELLESFPPNESEIEWTDEKLAAKYPYDPKQLPIARLEDGTMWDW
mgnify:CR=1 FL=1